MTGWALLTTGLDVRQAVPVAAECGHPVTTLVTDPLTGVALVAAGMASGLIVARWEVLYPVVKLLVPPAYGHGHEVGRRPEIRTGRVRPEWTR